MISETKSGNIISFGRGRFDEWCVYLTRKGKNPYAPRDPEYFTYFRNLAARHSPDLVYGLFVSVYSRTGRKLETSVIELIRARSQQFAADAEEIETWLTVIYAGMVAEENKAFSRLGKRIKHLGMHQVLKQGFPPDVAAVWSKGKKWPEISEECKKHGF